MAEHVVGPVEDLPVGKRRVIRAGRIEIGVFNVRGNHYALPNICPHQFGPLCDGRVGGTLVATAEGGWAPRWVCDGEVVACPWHGMQFNVTTGQSVQYRNIKLRQYAVKVENDVVTIVV